MTPSNNVLAFSLPASSTSESEWITTYDQTVLGLTSTRPGEARMIASRR